MFKPRADKSLAHRRLCLVDYPKQRTAFFFAEHSLSKLQIALGVVIELHILRFGIGVNLINALKTVHLGFFEVINQSAYRADNVGLVLNFIKLITEMI